MAVNLSKGGKVNLSKSVEKLANVTVGLGWDMATRGSNIDCDSSVFVLKKSKGGIFKKSTAKIVNDKDVVYYGNLTHSNGCIKHMGDNLTGSGDGDDEQIKINLKDMPDDVESLVVAINIFDCRSRGQNFGMIRNCFARVVDDATKEEICKYNLSDGEYDNDTAMIVCELYRENNEWHFKAIGEGTKDNNIPSLAKRYK